MPVSYDCNIQCHLPRNIRGWCVRYCEFLFVRWINTNVTTNIRSRVRILHCILHLSGPSIRGRPKISENNKLQTISQVQENCLTVIDWLLLIWTFVSVVLYEDWKRKQIPSLQSQISARIEWWWWRLLFRVNYIIFRYEYIFSLYGQVPK